jgi:signal transduction histidine kinase
MGRPWRLTIWIPLLLVASAAGGAGRLPTRQYSTEQGLPHDSVSNVVYDSHGFLWICNARGLSRFDGNELENYSRAHGLPGYSVTDIVENPDGTYWVSQWWNGMALFDPEADDPEALFTPVAIEDYPNARVHALLRDRAGGIWLATTYGLFALDSSSPERTIRRVEPEPTAEVSQISRIWKLIDDSQGNLWLATSTGLVRRGSDGRFAYRELVPGQTVEAYSLLEDREGRIWAGHDQGVTIFNPLDASGAIRPDGFVDGARIVDGVRLPDRPGDGVWISPADGIGDGVIAGLLQTRDDRIWLAPVKGGVTEFDGQQFHHHTRQELGFFLPRKLAEDGEGNIWIASLDRGVIRLARTGITAFTETEGLEFSSYASIVEDRQGRIVVTAGSALYRFDGRRFRKISPSFLAGNTTGRMGQNAIPLVDRSGGWWFGTNHGLYRFTGVDEVEELAERSPERIDLLGAGLPTEAVAGLFEDSTGSIWIGAQAAGELGRWDPGSGTLEVFHAGEELPAAAAGSFAEDRAGNLWIGTRQGVARRRDGRFETFGEGDGLGAAPVVFSLWVDDDGRLWITTVETGVYRSDDPGADRPSFEHFTTNRGLDNNYMRGVVQDRFGQVYLATNDGINRLDPESGRIRRYDTNHGLSNNEVKAGLRDRDGVLWFTSRSGVSRIEPRPDSDAPPTRPDMRITGIRVAGTPHAVSALGQTRVAGLRIAAADNRMQIDFGSIDFSLDSDLRYQYRLEGADRDWSAPTGYRSVNYAGLAPGSYRFAVRAVDEKGAISETPAVVQFRILPPLWRQWWVLTLAVALLAALVYAVHRYRLARVLELEGVRMRIATDLHDDLGSSLSRIAILSEVLHQRVDQDDAALTGPLSRIAGVSRELVDSMSDIVWAINPRRDRVSDLVQRMRRFASDTLAAREIDFTFRAPDEGRLKLGADIRRQVYLVFKESIHNALRHAGCSRVEIELDLHGDQLSLTIRDDGRGFAPDEEAEGHGLESMRRRASELRGTLQVESRPGSGTLVTLRFPLRARLTGLFGR